MEIFIKEFRTTNELLLKTRSNLLSELKIEVNELSKVVSNVLIPKNEVKGVTTRGGKMTSEATHTKEINKTGINKTEPLRFEQDVLEEACTEIMNERCSAVLLNKLPSKEKDPRSFTTPCQVLEKHKEAEDLVVDHLSRFENPHMEVLTEREIADKFFDEHLMVLNSKFNNDEPWYADFVNYIVGKEPYAFKLCTDNIMRRCMAGSETLEILAHCHSGPIGGHHSANITAKKVYESGFYWPSVFKDANEYVRRCDACQRLGNISSKNEMPQNNIQVCEVFDVWGLDFIGPFPQSRVPKALISDRGTHFCNSELEKALQRYGVTHKLSMAYHPQFDGQTKVTNRAIKRILERSVGLNELAELRDGAYENTRIYKERTKKWHDSRLRGDKDIKVGDKVLLYNSRLRMYPGKLKSKWSGPNIVKTMYLHGAIEITDKTGLASKSMGND
ncbi:reverse transcriptase domain-containing protein [Tanacetum coccineum]